MRCSAGELCRSESTVSNEAGPSGDESDQAVAALFGRLRGGFSFSSCNSSSLHTGHIAELCLSLIAHLQAILSLSFFSLHLRHLVGHERKT